MRLFQAVCMLAVEFLEGTNAVPWSRARAQFALGKETGYNNLCKRLYGGELIKAILLGRRYLRFFKFIPTLSAASSSVFSSLNPFVVLLETGKMGFLGLYLMLESSTIVSCCFIYFLNFPRLQLISGLPKSIWAWMETIQIVHDSPNSDLTFR
jgi:hypothetical protein